MFPIPEISDVQMVFPANVLDYMPKYEDIPKKYKTDSYSGTNRLFNDWFFRGLKELSMKTREGVDEGKAIRAIRSIMGSYAPKHEHKEAAVAFLLDEWFTDIKWESK